jgi:alanine racemase
MTLRSEIIGVQTLKAGDTVGYGSRYRAKGEQRIGIVAGGYADGYPRIAPTDACLGRWRPHGNGGHRIDGYAGR